MTTEKAIKVLQTEILCVKRDCARIECAKCDLVLEQSDILTAYDMAISALSMQEALEKNTRLIIHNDFSEEDIEAVRKALEDCFGTIQVFDFDQFENEPLPEGPGMELRSHLPGVFAAGSGNGGADE